MDQRVITQDIIDLYDEFTHTTIQRRVFMQRLARLAGGTAAAAALVPLLQNNYAKAAIVAPDDNRLEIKRVMFKGASGDVKGYEVRPKNAQKLPAVVIVHENRGLNPHIEDVARRIAIEGFVALAPDLLSQIGGTPSNEEEATQLIRKIDGAKTLGDGVAAVSYLKSHPSSTGKIGAIGFCWGGGMVNLIAANSPDLIAAAPYYGDVPEIENAKKVKAKMLLHYASLDERINKNADAWVNALKAAGVDVQSHMYEGANHAFNNDTSPRYHEPSAKQAWSRTVEFFKKNLA